MVQPNNNIIGNTAAVTTLHKMVTDEQVAHSILLVGPEKIGRTAIALQFAATLNCMSLEITTKPCGVCRACRLIQNNSHPDLIHLIPGDVLCRGGGGHEAHPNSRDIRICQIRGLIETVSRYPFEAPWRVIIIEPAEQLGREAANALLKTLEEPPNHTIFILISKTLDSLPETIVSRCRQLSCTLVNPKIIEQELLMRNIPVDIVSKAINAANKKPGLAIQFSENPKLIEERAQQLGHCQVIAESSQSDRAQYVLDLVDRWRKNRTLVYEELEIWNSFWEDILLEAAKTKPSSQFTIQEALAGLKAVTTAKNNLEALVIPRLCLELMLLQFPLLSREN